MLGVSATAKGFLEMPVSSIPCNTYTFTMQNVYNSKLPKLLY